MVVYGQAQKQATQQNQCPGEIVFVFVVVAGVTVIVVGDGLQIDSGRFTIGNSVPETEITADDTISPVCLIYAARIKW